MYAAIDFGISNTDGIAYLDGEWRRWTRPSKGRPDLELVHDILAAGGIELASLQRLAVTGGQALAGSSADDGAPLLVVSAGSGTAVVAAQGEEYAHVTGTAVGGGTLLGLSRLLLHTVDHDEIDALARQGDPNGVDLSLGDGELYGVPIILPADSGYGTALGALLHTAGTSLCRCGDKRNDGSTQICGAK